jgi:transcriptional regulator with XRE-family HTH domain
MREYRKKTKQLAGLRDRLIGGRIRQRRMFLGLSQSELGGRVGLTFQQVQKYETGFNKLSASRLVDFCAALGVPILYAYGDVLNVGAEKQASLLDADRMVSRESVTLLSNYWAIEDAALRETVLRLVRQAAWLGRG